MVSANLTSWNGAHCKVHEISNDGILHAFKKDSLSDVAGMGWVTVAQPAHETGCNFVHVLIWGSRHWLWLLIVNYGPRDVGVLQ